MRTTQRHSGTDGSLNLTARGKYAAAPNRDTGGKRTFALDLTPPPFGHLPFLRQGRSGIRTQQRARGKYAAAPNRDTGRSGIRTQQRNTNTKIQKYKYKNTNTKIQIQKYKYKNTNTKIQIQKYITQIQIQKRMCRVHILFCIYYGRVTYLLRSGYLTRTRPWKCSPVPVVIRTRYSPSTLNPDTCNG